MKKFITILNCYLLTFIVPGFTWADESTDQEIAACYKSPGGKVRVVENGKACRHREHGIVLNRMPVGRIIATDSKGDKLPGDLIDTDGTRGTLGLYIGERLYFMYYLSSRWLSESLYFDDPTCEGAAYVVAVEDNSVFSIVSVDINDKAYIPEPGSVPVLRAPPYEVGPSGDCRMNFSREKLVAPAKYVLDVSGFVPPFGVAIKNPSTVIDLE